MWPRLVRDIGNSELVRRGSQDFVQSLQLPPVASVRDLLPFVGEHIGQSIQLQPAEVGESVPCGMWIATRTASYVFYDPDTSPAHQDHIIAHEFGHMLKGHRGSRTLPTPDAGGLLTLLDPALIQAVLGRTDYAQHDEQEAEMVGSYLQEHANSYRPPSSQGLWRTAEADRIARTLLRE
ncbi:M48 family metalloprotease [Streptomyces avermitilis]|uniref:hypothetical protein n=1 Tax=Streptomyces avermitilis TaxID=33903 RepID=UPI003800532E